MYYGFIHGLYSSDNICYLYTLSLSYISLPYKQSPLTHNTFTYNLFTTERLTMNSYTYSNNSVYLDKYEIFNKIQNIYYNLLIQSLIKHCKVFVIRIDIHLPQELDQRLIMIFNHRFIEKEKIAKNDPLYLVVRELSSEGKIHHHMVLFLNGNVTNNTFYHFEYARTVLRNICGDYGNINECNDGHRNGIMIERNMFSPYDLYEALRQISYLAKTNQKDNVLGKTFFYSKVPILPLSNEDIARHFQSLFPNLSFVPGMKWFAN